jgi:hypothetical protein
MADKKKYSRVELQKNVHLHYFVISHIVHGTLCHIHVSAFYANNV